MPSQIELANAIRALTMDAVQAANSGHPGAPMGMADIAEVLWNGIMRHNPANPDWPNRDRFVLSNGHGSMLIYALLHLTGYDLSVNDLKQFRQLHSKTPGHPEYGYTPGVETTTGPLGQGIANAVGMALSETLAAQFNRDGHAIVDHHTWVFLGDGCLMEGISHERALWRARSVWANSSPFMMTTGSPLMERWKDGSPTTPRNGLSPMAGRSSQALMGTIPPLSKQLCWRRKRKQANPRWCAAKRSSAKVVPISRGLRAVTARR